MKATALGTGGSWFLVCAFAAWSLVPGRAHARRFYRARFETEALEQELPGEVEIDAQMGGYYGDGPDHSRLVAPDLEIDVGICAWLEIDLDAAVSFTQLGAPPVLVAGDPVWLSARVDAFNWKDRESSTNCGIGLLAGPRLPSINTPHGVGFAGLALFGGGTRALQLVGNLGALLDRGHPAAILYGVDAQYAVNQRWSLLGNLAAAHYFGPDQGQLLLALGVAYASSERLTLSLLAVGGPALRGDRAGLLLGVSRSFQGWGRADQRPSEQSPGPS
jgi:hypothetical protein